MHHPSAVESASAYNDLQGLQSIKDLASKDQSAALTEVAAEFESLLVNMMLKNMRSATNTFAEDSLLGSDQVSFYQSMLDDQWSVELTSNNGLGFADSIVRQLGAHTRAIIDDTPHKASSKSVVKTDNNTQLMEKQKGIDSFDAKPTQSLDETLFTIHRLKKN